MKHLLILCLGLLVAQPLAAQSGNAQPAVSGLKATFFAGDAFRQPLLTRTDQAIDFNWDQMSPAPGVPVENYCVRWTGVLRAPVSGIYTIQATTDDGMRVWIGGKKLIDEWRPQSPTNFRARIELKAGEYYPLRVDYYQLGYQARAQLSWMLPNAEKSRPGNLFGMLNTEPEPVPASAFFVAAPIPPAPPKPAVVAVAPTPVRPNPAPVAPAPVRPTPAPVAAAPRPRPVVRPTSPPAATPTAAVPATAARPATPDPAATPAPPQDLGKLAKGTTVVVQQLFFEQGKPVLLPTARPALAQLTNSLRANPDLRLEISGHTDNQGDPAQNQQLSEERAQVVRRYLMDQGIDSTRLTAVGYGGTRPVANNNDLGQRPRNRRVEVTVR